MDLFSRMSFRFCVAAQMRYDIGLYALLFMILGSTLQGIDRLKLLCGIREPVFSEISFGFGS